MIDIPSYFKSMERASSVPDLTSESKKRALGDTSFEDSESPANKHERLTSPLLTSQSSVWKDSPIWAQLLRSEIFDLKTSMEKLLQMKEEIKSEIKDDLTKFKSELNSQVLDMKNTADFISGKYDKVNNTANLALDKSEKLQHENLKLQTEIEELKLVADEAEQYSRRNCLILTGVPEVQKENTDDIVKDVAQKWLNVQLDTRSIDRSHRLGKKTLHGKPRPIIVKLCNYHDKEKMYQAKKNLKGTKIMIVESLTKRRLELLKRAKETFGATNVWTLDGKIFTNKGADADGKRYLIKTADDIYKI